MRYKNACFSIILALVICLSAIFPVCSAYAADSCDHKYKITSFSDSGTATIKCSLCGDTYTDDFINHVNAYQGDDNYTEVFDIYPDGVINAKDYHLLCKCVYDDGETVVNLEELTDDLNTIKNLMFVILVAVGIIIGSSFLKHFSFWKW